MIPPKHHLIPGTRFCIHDILDRLEVSNNVGEAIAYLCRQGRKLEGYETPRDAAMRDLDKAITCAQRELERLRAGGKYIGLGPELGDDDA